MKKSSAKVALDREPFPEFIRPSHDECAYAVDALSSLHGLPLKDEVKMTVLDSLVRTILSQNTTDKTSRQAFSNLKATFRSWKAVLQANSKDIEDSIRIGGLAEAKVNFCAQPKNIFLVTYFDTKSPG